MRKRANIGLILVIAGMLLDIAREIADLQLIGIIAVILVVVGAVIAIPAISKEDNLRKRAIIALSLFAASMLLDIAQEIADIWILGIAGSILSMVGVVISTSVVITLVTAKNTDTSDQPPENKEE